MRGVTIELATPEVDGLDAAVGALREWQQAGAPRQLHPGDLGWFWRFGAETTAARVRTWRRDGQVLAVGLVDEPDLLRVTLAPEAYDDEELARRMTEDLGDPARGVLVEGDVYVEAPEGALLRETLSEAGWRLDDPWTPLCRDLAEPVEDPGVRIEVAGPRLVADRTAVQRAAFNRSTFTEERWHAMAAGPAYADARCLVAYDERGDPVATITVWSAGPGRPGLVEPMGVHRDHRGRGHGRAITLAGAAALREMGASSALVATPSSNVGGVATYVAAGFEALPEVRDLSRAAAKNQAPDTQ